MRLWPFVASILLAFAIDAWWEERGERRTERAALARLIAEYESNLAGLDAVRREHQQVLEAIDKLMAYFAPDQQSLTREDTDRVGNLIADTLTNPKFDPQLGATQSLIASGDLSLISDAGLQTLLSAWPSAAQDLIDWQVIERTHGEELIAPFTFDYVAWPGIDLGDEFPATGSAFTSDLNGLFRSMRLEGLYFNRRYNYQRAIDRITTLERTTRVLLERLRLALED